MLGIVNVSKPGFLDCKKEYESITQKPTVHSQYLLDKILPLQQSGNWAGVARILESAVEDLKQQGATYAIIPANSVHFAFEKAQFSIPTLNLVDIVAQECAKYTRVGVLGVNFTMEGGLYTLPLQKRGVEEILPTPKERVELDTVIYRDLVKNNITEQAQEVTLRIARMMRDRGCDALVLACTELPLVLSTENTGIPCLDSTKLLAHAAASYSE